MIYKHWMHKQQDPWVLFLRCYQHLTGEASLPPRKNPSKGSIVQSYAKFWQRTSFSLHHAMKLAGLKHSREVPQEVGCESEDLNRHDSAGGRERVSSMERLDLNVSQQPACQKPGCQSGTIRWSNPGEAEPSGRYLEHWKGLKVDGMTPVSPSLPSAPQSVRRWAILLYRMILPGHTMAQVQSNLANQLWTRPSKTMSQNQSFLFIKWLSMILCDSAGMLTHTGTCRKREVI